MRNKCSPSFTIHYGIVINKCIIIKMYVAHANVYLLNVVQFTKSLDTPDLVNFINNYYF